MYLKVTYAQQFGDLIMHLKSKYPRRLFDMEGIGKQTDMSLFSKDFFTTKTVASDVSVDDNSNVDDMSVITYTKELPKPFFKLNSYYVLWKKMKQLYGKARANEIVEKQLTGDIYINDFTGVGAGIPYCMNYSTYDVALLGLPMIKKIISSPPKYLYSFKSQLEQFVVIAANSTLGATGLADMLIVMAYYVDKIFRTGKDASFAFASEEDAWLYIKETIVSFIYTVNQPNRGNQCVTEDTEVLTPVGFKTYDMLSEGDSIYTWDNGKLNIQKVDRVNVYDYDGEMHCYTGRDFCQCVTPNHRILHKKNNNRDEYLLSESCNLIDKKTPLTVPVAMIEDDREDYNISDDMLKLCVMILTDGNIDTEKNGRIKLYKSPKRYGNKLIKETLESLGVDYSLIERPSVFDGTVNHYDITTDNSQEILNILNSTKKELPDWFFNLSKRQANIAIDLWSKFDGYNGDNRQKLQCDNYKIADQLQHVCFLAGRGSRITSRLIGNNKKETIYLIPYNRINKDACKKEKIHYKGKVWCPSTKDGVVVFRKNGKVFISGNSPFTNISIFDDNFLNELAPDYRFVEGDEVITPKVSTIKKLQEMFLHSMNHELRRTPITFPITTACFSVDEDHNIQDENFLDLISKENIEFGFINMYAGKTSTLSSCCRLRSDKSNEYFNSFGSGSTKIGSLGVCTINLPRIAFENKGNSEAFIDKLIELAVDCQHVNNAKRSIIKKRIESGNLPLYDHGFMDINKQYSTIGVNGFYEAVTEMGYDIMSNEGQEFAIMILETLNTVNDRLQKQYEAPHNVEQVPGESLSVKLASKDKLFRIQDKYDFYSNQFIPLICKADLLDRITLQGLFDSHFSGGAIAHLNVEQRIEDYNIVKKLIRSAVKKGVIYFAVNYTLQRCAKSHMSVGRGDKCYCGADIIETYQRVVGFLTATRTWNKTRRELDEPNRVFYKNSDIKF